MGYTTDFSGEIEISPPLSKDEIKFLQKFSRTRRMNRKKGPYFVEGSGDYGQGADPDILDHNQPPDGQPGLWCQWVPNDDGSALEWDGGEKFYNSAEWMKYLIDHFISPDHLALFNFLKGHTCNGIIYAQGEDSDDRWRLIVKDNVVTTQAALPLSYGDSEPV